MHLAQFLEFIESNLEMAKRAQFGRVAPPGLMAREVSSLHCYLLSSVETDEGNFHMEN